MKSCVNTALAIRSCVCARAAVSRFGSIASGLRPALWRAAFAASASDCSRLESPLVGGGGGGGGVVVVVVVVVVGVGAGAGGGAVVVVVVVVLVVVVAGAGAGADADADA